MELLAGSCRKRPGDDFSEDADPFGGSDWVYGGRSLRTQGNDDGDDALATLADLAPPPQKLKPIRCVVNKSPLVEDRHPLDILAGSLDRLPEMGFLEDGCFDAHPPLGSKIADVEESGQLTRGFVGKGEHHQTEVHRVGVSLSSSVNSDSEEDSSQGVVKAVTGKRKRETREKLESFMEKLVGTMMKRQEQMHNQLINVMEKIERERVRSEEAWRQQEMERMKENEEARKQEMSRSSSLISFIKSVLGDEIKIAQPLQTIPRQREWEQRQGEVKFVFPSGRRWPQEEVQALIASRSEVEEKTGVVHKGAIWDDISARMKVKGYERSAKKCKEKWENMNKYYKRVMESSKKQPENTKTRSYFEKLGNFYKTNSVTVAEHSGEKEQ